MGLDDGIPEKEVIHTHEDTGVTHKHKGGNKPHTHEEKPSKSCICKDSRLVNCPEHGDKN